MISERTRDKIAASRRKGKWTGGPVPFGYSVKDKKLLVNEAEAHVVREAFALFLAAPADGDRRAQLNRARAPAARLEARPRRRGCSGRRTPSRACCGTRSTRAS
jgi:site-specific DNA recombinase